MAPSVWIEYVCSSSPVLRRSVDDVERNVDGDGCSNRDAIAVELIFSNVFLPIERNRWDIPQTLAADVVEIRQMILLDF